MALRKTGWGLILVGLLVQSVSAAQYDGPKVLLKQRYPSGSYLMTTTMNGSQSVSMEGQPQPEQQIAQRFVVIMDVGEPDAAGLRTMQMVFSQVKQDITMGPQTLSYDSQGPADKQDPNLARALGSMTKAKISVKIGPDDKVAGASGMDEMWDDWAKATPEMAAFARQMKSQMGDAAIADMVSKASQTLPADPVGPGDEWEPTATFKMPMIGELQVKQHCKLLDIEKTPAGNVAVIQYEGTAQSSKETTSDVGGTAMKVLSVVFKQAGKMRFNVDTGMAESQVMDQDGTMAMAMPGPQEGQEVKVNSQQKMKLETTIAKRTPEPAK